MTKEELLKTYGTLSAEERLKLERFIAKLRKQHAEQPEPKQNPRSFKDEPFFGMWKDREDMKEGGSMGAEMPPGTDSSVTMILVDSDILIQYSRGDIAAAEWLEAASNRDELGISVVTEIELVFGSRDKIQLKQTQKLINTFEIIHINEAISRKTSYLIARYCLSHRIELPDAMIAATALEFDFDLATINRRDFRFVDGLRLADYP